MKALREFPREKLVGMRGVLFDIDDTLTTEGRLTAEAYAAVESLQLAGLLVAAITGRPAGWCDHIARMWPVDGVVGENGAFYFYFDRTTRRLRQRFIADAAQRTAQKIKLAKIAERILHEVPGTALASDQNYREADLAIDFCEDVPALPLQDAQRIQALMEAKGLTAKISSIHVNGWLGGYDKLSTTQLFLREVFDIDLAEEKAHFVFVGDSPNDAPMFSYFPYSVGVANVKDWLDLLPAHPAYVTEARCGVGFAELARLLINKRDAC